MKKVISLTSIPPRFTLIFKSLESLVLQNAADEIRLYIPYHYQRFPEWNGQLPDVPRGVTIVRVEKDLGPATKLLYAVREFAGQDVQILFCDDDGTHRRGWAKRLFDEQMKRPEEAVATWGRDVKGYLPEQPAVLRLPRVRSIPLQRDIRYRSTRVLQKLFGYQPVKRPSYTAGYADVFFGVGGVVVRPSFFDETAFDIPTEAWLVDDVWLSAMLAKRGIPIYCPARLPMPLETEASFTDPLLDVTQSDDRRQQLNRQAARYCRDVLGIWK